MSRSPVVRALAGLGFLLIAAGATPALAETPAPAAPGSSALEGLDQYQTLAQKNAYATSANQEIGDYVRAVTTMKNRVGDDDPEVKQCLTTKLTSLSALYQVSTAAQQRLADPSTDPAMVDHEFRKIAVALAKSRTLFAEAQQCTATGPIGSGTTLVDWEAVLSFTEDQLDLAIDELALDWQPPELSPFNSSGG